MAPGGPGEAHRPHLRRRAGPRRTTVITVADGVALGNDGGTITVLNPAGLKVHGVAYTGTDAHREGWTVVF